MWNRSLTDWSLRMISAAVLVVLLFLVRSEKMPPTEFATSVMFLSTVLAGIALILGPGDRRTFSQAMVAHLGSSFALLGSHNIIVRELFWPLAVWTTIWAVLMCTATACEAKSLKFNTRQAIIMFVIQFHCMATVWIVLHLYS